MNRVHVLGTGTIGEPLISLLTELSPQLKIDEVTFAKRSASEEDRSTVQYLCGKGAKLCSTEEQRAEFERFGMKPTYEYEEGIKRATVVIDCTPSKKGKGIEEKHEFFHGFKQPRLVVAQGSEFGFGEIYAYGINDDVFSDELPRYVTVASCNTHNIAAIIKTLAFKGGRPQLKIGDFVIIRRTADISQADGYVPSLKFDKHDHERFGTHHARDANALFDHMCELDIFSSSCVISDPFMHGTRFRLQLYEDTTREEMIAKIKANPLVSITYKYLTTQAFSVNREQGYKGRSLNQSIFYTPGLSVKGGRVIGFTMTPQDGNSLLSSVAITARALHGSGYQEKLNPILFPDKYQSDLLPPGMKLLRPEI